MENVAGKIVFVTGGAHGIGRAIVSAFCEEGAKVLFCDIEEDASLKFAAETGAVFFRTDVSKKEELISVMQIVFERFGDIDILVNNAGISCFSALIDTEIEDFDHVLAVNLRSVFITSKMWIVHRTESGLQNKYGRIINIASTRFLMSESGSEAYAASKGGIVSLTHALAVSLSGYQVTVNCISPGWIETGDYARLTSADHEQHPSGRVGKPDDIARACLFLADPQNDFINGQNLIIDGGMTRKMIYLE